MASKGTAFYDANGQYHKTADEATISDLAALFGRVGAGSGDSEGLAHGIAKTLFDKRADFDAVFAEHDGMMFALTYFTAVSADDMNTTRLGTG